MAKENIMDSRNNEQWKFGWQISGKYSKGDKVDINRLVSDGVKRFEQKYGIKATHVGINKNFETQSVEFDGTVLHDKTAYFEGIVWIWNEKVSKPEVTKK